MSATTTWIGTQVGRVKPAITALPPAFRLACVLVAFLLLAFIFALAGSKSGEISSALGSLIGGMVGAGGAVWAVFLMLSRQKQEEATKVADAVRTEVTTLVKYIVSAVEICQKIKSGDVKIPRQDAHDIVKNFARDPVIYPAIADRVGLLPHPHATIEFYMRLAETKMMVEMLRTKTDPVGITYSSPPLEHVKPEFAESVADSLITALQLARPIVANEGDLSAKSQLAALVQVTVVGQIDQCMSSAKRSFPNAESFREVPKS